MDLSAFDGQQEGERILYVITPHPVAMKLAIVKIVLLSLFLILMMVLIGTVVQSMSAVLTIAGILCALLLLCIGLWWNITVFKKAKTFITDRRIIRFDVVSPFFTTKRALFWNEALKAKGYSPNILYRMVKIGILVVEPQVSDHEDVRVHDVYYFEDLANYIDKILFTFKNTPAEIANLRPFVPKPKGKRD
jgi:hypothetical protein